MYPTNYDEKGNMKDVDKIHKSDVYLIVLSGNGDYLMGTKDFFHHDGTILRLDYPLKVCKEGNKYTLETVKAVTGSLTISHNAFSYYGNANDVFAEAYLDKVRSLYAKPTRNAAGLQLASYKALG